MRYSGQFRAFSRRIIGVCLLVLMLLSMGVLSAQDDAPTPSPAPATPDEAGIIITEEAPPDENDDTTDEIIDDAPPPESFLPPIAPAPVLEVSTPDYVSHVDGFVLFPTGIWSHFVLDRPASDFAAVSLLVEQDGWGRNDSLIINLADIAEIDEPFTEFTYTWMIPANNPPRPFRDIRLTWRFVQNNGTVDNVEITLPFSDHRATWRTSTGDRLTLALASNRANPVLLREELDALYALMVSYSNQQVNAALVFYDRGFPPNPCTPRGDEAFVARTGQRRIVELPCNPQDAQRLYSASGYEPITVEFANNEAVIQTVSAELIERMYASRWAGADVPEWFIYGLSLFYTAQDKSALLIPARDAARTRNLLHDLNTVPQDPTRLELWRVQSYGYVLFMAEQIGVEGLLRLAGSVNSEVSLGTAYARVARAPLASVAPAWRDWVFSVQAETAYGYNPYLPITPTPTETGLPPTYPPTPTPTETLTETPTITPTVTGVLSPTPRPTLTPSPTFTPTVTPRPAGSVPLPPTRAP